MATRKWLNSDKVTDCWCQEDVWGWCTSVPEDQGLVYNPERLQGMAWYAVQASSMKGYLFQMLQICWHRSLALSPFKDCLNCTQVTSLHGLPRSPTWLLEWKEIKGMAISVPIWMLPKAVLTPEMPVGSAGAVGGPGWQLIFYYSPILLPSPASHRYGSQGYPLINILCPKLERSAASWEIWLLRRLLVSI